VRCCSIGQSGGQRENPCWIVAAGVLLRVAVPGL
jgi:hypothetical protein